jgi:hypothetical protein
MTPALCWFFVALAVLFFVAAAVGWSLWDKLRREKYFYTHGGSELGKALTRSHETHARDNDIHQRRERVLRRHLVRITELLDSALEARVFGDVPSTWEQHWKDIQEAHDISAVFDAER